MTMDFSYSQNNLILPIMYSQSSFSSPFLNNLQTSSLLFNNTFPMTYGTIPQIPLFNLQMPNFTFPNFNLGLFGKIPSINFGTLSSSKPASSKVDASSIKFSSPTGKHDLNWWKAQGYDEEMGKKLAADAVAHARRDPGQCVGYVRRSLNRVYGSLMKNAGAAYKFGSKIMADPVLSKRFKKIDVRGLKSSEFPEGAIVLWKPGTKGYTKGKAALYGHGAIAHNGTGVANGVVSDLSTYAEVWIPVKA